MSVAIDYLITAINDILTAFGSMMFYQSGSGDGVSASLYSLILYLIFFVIFMLIFRKVVKHG